MPAFRTGAYTHKQITPSTEWTINHGLGGNPAVSVSINYEGRLVVILPLEIEHVDASTVKVRFSTPQSGEARLN